MRDFNIKFRLLGYYWNINQKINEEKIFLRFRLNSGFHFEEF